MIFLIVIIKSSKKIITESVAKQRADDFCGAGVFGHEHVVGYLFQGFFGFYMISSASDSAKPGIFF
jgi:hypothetical protein